jgi:hypothetical protein
MTPVFDSLYQQLLTEMPMAIGKMDKTNDLGYMKYRPVYDSVDEFTVKGLKVEVLMHTGFKRTKPHVKYELVNNDKIIGLYQGKEFKQGIITNYAQTEPFVKGESLMFNFYKNFLLKRYSFVISDDSLSDAGFGFFYKNFDKFRELGYKVFVYDENYTHPKDIELNDKEELHKYYGNPLLKPLAGKQRYRVGKE